MVGFRDSANLAVGVGVTCVLAFVVASLTLIPQWLYAPLSAGLCGPPTGELTDHPSAVQLQLAHAICLRNEPLYQPCNCPNEPAKRC